MNALLSRVRDALRDPNPLVRKELLAVLRAPLYVRAIVVALVLLGLVVVSVALNAAESSNPTEAGRVLFQVFFGGAFLAMALVGPAFGATAIVQEREGRTLDALLLTGLRPGRIVAGKLAAVFVAMAFILVVSVPLLAVVSLLRNDEVEVRLMKPPAAPTGSATEPPPAGFALFQLTRHKSDCGF